jgi:hypothetical protein
MPKEEVKERLCRHCDNWKNEQAELEYVKYKGICVCHKWEFGNTNYEDIMLLDRNNLSNKHMTVQRFENKSIELPIGQVNRSRYCLVTDQDFGCKHQIFKGERYGS